MNLIKREKVIQLDDTYKEIKKSENGTFCGPWIKKDETEYLTKMQGKRRSLEEIFWSFVIHELGLPRAQYYLAKTKQNKYCTITPNYNPHNLPKCSLKELMIAYYKIHELEKKKMEIYDLYNLQDLKTIFNFFFQFFGDKCLEKLNNGMYIAFIIQLLLGNCDLNAKNIEIIIATYPQLSPYFDFGSYGQTKLNDPFTDFYLSYERQQESIYAIPEKVFSHFIKKASKEELEILYYYMQKIREINSKKIFEQIEEENHQKVSKIHQRILKRRLIQNTETIEEYLKEK